MNVFHAEDLERSNTLLVNEIAYFVQSVPARKELRKRLLADIPPAVTVEDDGPPPPSPWRGYRLCLQAFLETKASHAVIIQDDCVVCRNFAPAIELIAQAHPNMPVCLFVSGTRSKTLNHYAQAMRSKLRYSNIWFQDFLPVVAVLWPRTKVEEFLEWTKDMKLPGMPNPRSDDAVVGSWMKFTRQRVLATIPSLVEHPDDTLSVKWHTSQVPSGTGNKRRRAFAYIGDADPLELDWTML